MSRLTSQEVAQRLIEAVEKLGSNDAWTDYLRFSRTFHQYSPTNRLFIYLQCPHATQVAGYRKWAEVGRQVRKGEKGIRILAPLTRKVTDEATGVETTRLTGFREVSVFDISQTDGDPVPTNPFTPQLLTGDADGFDTIATYITGLGFAVERGDCDGANGYTNFATRKVRVRDDVDDAQAVKTLAHEAAHATLHNPDGGTFTCTGRAEVEAESVAFIVGDALGLDTSAYSFGYIAGWATATRNADKPGAEIRAALDRITTTADAIIAHIQGA